MTLCKNILCLVLLLLPALGEASKTSPYVVSQWVNMGAAILDLHIDSNGKIGWAVGRDGTILHTRSGGVTWRPQASGTDVALLSIQFLSDGKTGWATGEDGVILHTGDGGVIWRPQTSETDVALLSIQFLSDGKIGWATGEDGVILHTRGGGSIWRSQTSGTDKDIYTIEFLSDGKIGWAAGVGGVLLNTRDGGVTWRPQVSGTDEQIYAIEFLTYGKIGWAACDGGVILHTRDGGATWRPQASGTDKDIYTIEFSSDGKIGWAAGDGGVILHTRDGGATWRPQASETEKEINAIEFLSDGKTGWAVGEDGILHTLDGGAIWRIYSSSVDKIIYAIKFLSDGKTGWAVGEEGVILHTIDDGATWRSQASGIHKNIYAIEFLSDGKTGWAASEEGDILNTRDGGATWRLQTSGTDKEIYTIELSSDGKTVWAVGDDGIILHTRDGGASWRSQTSGTVNGLRPLQFLTDGKTGWAAGAEGTILHTRDGGAAWAAQTSGTDKIIFTMQFLSDGKTGWAAGAAGAILHTRNGGATWRPQVSGTDKIIYAIEFLSDGKTGWAVGYEIILATIDGGNHWQVKNIENTLVDIEVTADNSVIRAVGSILYTGFIKPAPFVENFQGDHHLLHWTLVEKNEARSCGNLEGNWSEALGWFKIDGCSDLSLSKRCSCNWRPADYQVDPGSDIHYRISLKSHDMVFPYPIALVDHYGHWESLFWWQQLVFCAFLLVLFYPIHFIWLWPSVHATWYRTHPVAFGLFAWIPFPGINRLLAAYTDLEPDKGEKEIDRLLKNPVQQTEALKARIRVIARQTAKIKTFAALESLIEKLPQGRNQALQCTPKLQTRVKKLIQQERKMREEENPLLHTMQKALLHKDLENFDHEIKSYPPFIAEIFTPAITAWEKLLQESAIYAPSTGINQVYRAGDPIKPACEAFIPRTSLMEELKRPLLLATGCPGILLYGRRRMGKTTLVKNLSGLIPDQFIPIYLSWQNPDVFLGVDSLTTTLGKEIKSVLPEFSCPSGHDLAGFYDLLKSSQAYLEEENQDRKLILIFDEYETIDDKIGDKTFTVDFLATLRESIQTHRNLIWLFSGSHHVSELTHAQWSSYFVSIRTVKVPPFTFQETQTLLTDPLKYSPFWQSRQDRPRFDAIWGRGGIERIYRETGGWPNFVQLVAESLIDCMNEMGEQQADAQIYQAGLDRAIETGELVLRRLILDECTNDAQKTYLCSFRDAEVQSPPIDVSVAQALRLRELVEIKQDGWRLRVPLMRRWLVKFM